MGTATHTSTPVALGATPLTPGIVTEVAAGRRVALADEARARMLDSRALLERILERGDVVYGLSTGVGALKTVAVAPVAQDAFNQLLLRAHVAGSGQAVPAEWVRATMLVRAAGMAVGAAGVRAALAEAFCDALNAGFAPTVHRIGSVGQADLSQLAEIGLALIGEGPDGTRLAEHGLAPLVLEAREAHAIVNSNAFSTGVACLGLERARSAVAALEVSAALSYEGIVGNVNQVHPAVDRLRPYDGHRRAAAHLRALLAGGALATGATPARMLQDVLSFKTIGQVQGAARDSLAELRDQLLVELASSGDSPIMILDEDRAISTGNHDATAARSRARLRPARRRECRNGRGRARAEAPDAAFQRPLERASRRPGGPGRRPQHDRRRRHGVARRRDPSARRADDARAPHVGRRGGDRGSDQPGAGRRRAPRRAGGARPAARSDRARLRRAGGRPPRAGRRARARHAPRLPGDPPARAVHGGGTGALRRPRGARRMARRAGGRGIDRAAPAPPSSIATRSRASRPPTARSPRRSAPSGRARRRR